MNFGAKLPDDQTEAIQTMAAMCWSTFLALRNQGFSDTQALNIVGQMLSAVISNPPPK